MRIGIHKALNASFFQSEFYFTKNIYFYSNNMVKDQTIRQSTDNIVKNNI